MPNFNHAHYLSTSINALFSGKLKPEVLIFIDDCSSDDSVAKIRKLKKKYSQIKIFQNKKNLGVVRTCNAYLEKVSTEFVYFAAADDIVHPLFLERTVKQLSKNKKFAVCSTHCTNFYGDEHNCNPDLITQEKLRAEQTSPEMLLSKYKHRGFFQNGNATIYRTSLLKQSGGFQNFGPYADSVTIILLSMKFGASLIPEPLACLRVLKNSYSSRTALDPFLSSQLINAVNEFILRQPLGGRENSLAKTWRNRARYQIFLKQLGSAEIKDSENLSVLMKFGRAFYGIHKRMDRFIDFTLLLLISPADCWLLLRRRVNV